MSALALVTAPPSDLLETLHARVKADLRRRPGVYQFLDAAGAVYYVGKAKDLRARLMSYFTAPWPESKGAQLIRAAADIAWRYVPSEFAALLEEQKLIARLRPFSNVRGNRVRRRIVFVKLSGGPAPKLKVTEQTADRTARYYGPFQGSGWTAEGVRVLGDLLKLRDCAQDRALAFADQADLFGASLDPGCLRYELGTCLGPCAAKCAAGPYREAVARAVDFLEGRAISPLERVLEEMDAAAGSHDYERAAHWREKLDAVEALFAAVSRLRAATDALSFVYGVRDATGAGPGGGHDDRAYLIHRGLVRAEAPWPRTPLERDAFATTVARYAALPAGGLAARSATEMDQLLLVMSWFRQHPEEFDATTPLAEWAAGGAQDALA